MRGGTGRTRADGAIVLAWSAAVALAVLGPATGRGRLLLTDWVTGPASQLWGRVVSGEGLPTGPLVWATAALVDTVLGDAVGWVPFALALVAAGWAVSGFARTVPARLVAATAVIVNPFVYDRVYTGQLGMVAVMAPLALLARSVAVVAAAPDPAGDGTPGARTLPRPGLRAWLPVAGWWSAAAACTVHGLWLGAPAVAVGATSGWLAVRSRSRTVLGALAAAVLTAAVTAGWLLPQRSDAPSAGDGTTWAFFATGDDPRLGLAGAVLLQGGFWRDNPGAPDGSQGLWWAALSAAVLGTAVAGLVRMRPPQRAVLAATAGLAVVAALGTRGPTGWLSRWLLEELPGFAVMREPGKWVLWVSIATAAGLGAAVEAVGRRAAGRRPPAGWLAAAAVVAAVAIWARPVLFGLGGRLQPSSWPGAWEEVDRRAGVEGGLVLVLPFAGYADLGLTGGRVTAHPATAFFGRAALVSDDPEVPGLAPRDPRTGQVVAALAAPDPVRELRALGVRWLLVAPTTEAPGWTAGAGAAHGDGTWRWFDLGSG